jgi:geranylgeranyl pyrophosphate synthase
VLGGGTEEQIDALGTFAERIGIAFQIQDDILNFGETLGKGYGDDITEGKKSLPVIRTLKVASSEDCSRLKQILCMHTREKVLIDEAIGIIKRYDGITYSQKKAAELIKDSLKKVEEELEESEAKSLLKKLAEFMISRSY